MRNLVHEIGIFVNHRPSLRWVDRLARKCGLVHFLHMMRSKANGTVAQQAKSFQQFCNEHQEELQRVSEMLEDDFSRQTLERVLKYRQTGNIDALKGVAVQPEYFPKDIFGPVQDEVFVDGGAYTGDTVDNFIRIFAWGGV